MTKKTKASSTPTQTKRRHRTPDQIVADLQAEIERVKQRAAVHEARANPEARARIHAARSLNRAADACSGGARIAIDSARAMLVEQLAAMGLQPVPHRARRTAETPA
jgi:hypothetical protein